VIVVAYVFVNCAVLLDCCIICVRMCDCVLVKCVAYIICSTNSMSVSMTDLKATEQCISYYSNTVDIYTEWVRLIRSCTQYLWCYL
jgi:hypothetical protein